MKKFVFLSLIGFLILGMGATSYAMDYKFRGLLDFSHIYGVNILNPPYEVTGNFWGDRVASTSGYTGFRSAEDGARDKTRSYTTQRARLRFDAVASKELMGTIYFEMDSERWGEVSGDRNRTGYWMSDRAGVEVKNVYVTFGLPVIPVPTTMQVGIQPFQVRGITGYADGPGIQLALKPDPAQITLMWAKPYENEDFAADDNDIYAVKAEVKVQKASIGGYILYYNMNSLPSTGTITRTPAYRGGMGWYGLYVDGKLGPVDVNWDFVYDKGTVEDNRQNGPRNRDIDFSGWGTVLRVEYPWEKFNFGFLGVYGAGSDTKRTNQSGQPDGTATSSGAVAKKVGGYVAPPGVEIGEDISLVWGTGGGGFSRALTGYGASSSSYMQPGNIGGIWVAKLYVGFKVTPEYDVTLGGLYIGDTTKNGNTLFSPVKTGTATLRDDKSIGYEFDLLNTYQVYKNLKLMVGAGYLFALDGFDFCHDTIAGENDSFKNPWTVHTRLTYVF